MSTHAIDISSSSTPPQSEGDPAELERVLVAFDRYGLNWGIDWDVKSIAVVVLGVGSLIIWIVLKSEEDSSFQ